MKKTLIALSTAALCLGFSATASFAASHVGAAPMSGASGAAPMAKADTKAMKKQVDADYKAAKEKCKPMKGADQKACMKDAKVAHQKAEADVKAAKK